jgi:F0F1-type ATP synthase membrane subunit b/b'
LSILSNSKIDEYRNDFAESINNQKKQSDEQIARLETRQDKQTERIKESAEEEREKILEQAAEQLKKAQKQARKDVVARSNAFKEENSSLKEGHQNSTQKTKHQFDERVRDIVDSYKREAKAETRKLDSSARHRLNVQTDKFKQKNTQRAKEFDRNFDKIRTDISHDKEALVKDTSKKIEESRIEMNDHYVTEKNDSTNSYERRLVQKKNENDSLRDNQHIHRNALSNSYSNELQTAMKFRDNRFSLEKKEMEGHINRKASEYNNKITKMNINQAEQLSKLESDHSRIVSDIKQKYETKISRLNLNQKNEIVKQKSEATFKQQSLTDSFNAEKEGMVTYFKSVIENLQKNHSQEITNIQKKQTADNDSRERNT